MTRRLRRLAGSAYVRDVSSHLHIIPESLAGLSAAYALVVVLQATGALATLAGAR